MSNISTTIRKLREQAELSQNQLAAKSGVSVGFISKLEAGKYRTLSLDKSRQIADGLGMTLRDFLSEMGFLEDTDTPSVTLALQHALRSSGYTSGETKQVVNYAEYIKSQRRNTKS